MIKCRDCDSWFSEDEATYYECPGARWATPEDIDNDGEMTCPYCGSLDIISVPEEDDDWYMERGK